MQRKISQDDMINELAQNLSLLREAYDIKPTWLEILVGKRRQQISKIDRSITSLAWDTRFAIAVGIHNKNPIMFNEVTGKDYYTQFRDLINTTDNNTNLMVEEEII